MGVRDKINYSMIVNSVCKRGHCAWRQYKQVIHSG